MRNINVKFSCTEIESQRIYYELYSRGNSFEVVREGWNPKKMGVDLVKSVEFLLGDIRNFRVIQFLNSNHNIDSSSRALLEEQFAPEIDAYPHEIYMPYVQELTRAIISGKFEFNVLFKSENSFINGDIIYFDKAFLEEVQKIYSTKDLL